MIEQITGCRNRLVDIGRITEQITGQIAGYSEQT